MNQTAVGGKIEQALVDLTGGVGETIQLDQQGVDDRKYGLFGILVCFFGVGDIVWRCAGFGLGFFGTTRKGT